MEGTVLCSNSTDQKALLHHSKTVKKVKKHALILLITPGRKIPQQ